MTYWYVATPYTKYPAGLGPAFIMACRATAMLYRAAVPVFSPIAHSHSIAAFGEIDPLDHAFWMAACRPMMESADGLIVITAEGWRESKGVTEEFRIFKESRKPIFFMAENGPVPHDLLASLRETANA